MMKIRFLPSSRLGKLSAGLIITPILAEPLLYVFGELLEVLSGPFITVVTLLLIAIVIAAAVTGLIALVRFKDHSVLVYLAVIVGLAVIVYLLTKFWVDVRQAA